MVSLKHSFQSAKSDGTDSSLVQATAWNAEHVLTLSNGALLGRGSAGTGAAEEITLGTNLSLSGTTLNATGGGGSSYFTNKIINGGFLINQRAYVTNTALAAGVYAHDRWKAGAGGGTYTFTQSSPDTTITVTAGTLVQVVEGANIEGGTFTLSWSGNAQGQVNGGGFASSPVTVTGLTAGSNVTLEFNTGTLGLVMFNAGSSAGAFERRPNGIELVLCQRYYYRWNSPRTQEFLGVTYAYSTMHTEGGTPILTFPVEMRTATPTMGISNFSHFGLMFQNGGNSCSAMTLFANSRFAWIYDATWQAMNTFGIYTYWCNTASGWIDASAEL